MSKRYLTYQVGSKIIWGVGQTRGSSLREARGYVRQWSTWNGKNRPCPELSTIECSQSLAEEISDKGGCHRRWVIRGNKAFLVRELKT